MQGFKRFMPLELFSLKKQSSGGEGGEGGGGTRGLNSLKFIEPLGSARSWATVPRWLALTESKYGTKFASSKSDPRGNS